jgi:alpha-aminoadipate/glutamate carrier protein LysW
MVECPECGADVTVGEDAEVGEVIMCSDCGSELEVKSLEPVTLKLAPDEEEDWGQ